MSLSAIASGTLGMQRAADRLEASAGRVARFGTGLADVDLSTEMVDAMMAGHDFKAAATVVRVADRMSSSILDMLV